MIIGVFFEPVRHLNISIEAKAQKPNQLTHLAFKYACISGFLAWILAAIPFWWARHTLSPATSVSMWIIVGIIFSVVGGLPIVIKHYLLRASLWIKGNIPFNYVRFLDHATALIFMRKVGGGYIFVHRLVMEHFAGLSDSDIQRIVNDITTQPNRKG